MKKGIIIGLITYTILGMILALNWNWIIKSEYRNIISCLYVIIASGIGIILGIIDNKIEEIKNKGDVGK